MSVYACLYLGIGYWGGQPGYCLGTSFTKIKTSWQIDRNMFLNVCSQAPWHTTSQDQLWRSNDSLGNMDLQGFFPCHVAWELCFVAGFEEWLSCSLKLAQGGQEFMFPSRYSFIMFIYCYLAWETIHRDTTFLNPYLHPHLPAQPFQLTTHHLK